MSDPLVVAGSLLGAGLTVLVVLLVAELFGWLTDRRRR